QALFAAAYTWLGHYRGGVAMAAVGGCAGFGAISGSSLATAATMGQVALPELRRFNYSGALATGALAAGGTLGILIPPSVVLIIYAVMVEANVATLFQAALIPGILAALGYIAVIAIVVRVNPEAGPAGPTASRAEKWTALLEIWPVLLIFILVMGGIYFGIFTPTEGAGVGAFGTFLIAVIRGGMRFQGFVDALLGTAQTTAMIFLILLGFVMDSLSMIFLTVPIFWPIIAGLDFGMNVEETKLWFGIISLIVVEMGLITPPVGLNVFIINSMARDVPMIETFKGVIPFFMSDIVRVVVLVFLPGITLILPRLLN
ncbi:MAG: TRAP transporter large permease subunit, partial [Rhodospirillaceae bacterium]|nr:TRAP transporter large permease subunit [Rhodospirillaceae bacterium]